MRGRDCRGLSGGSTPGGFPAIAVEAAVLGAHPASGFQPLAELLPGTMVAHPEIVRGHTEVGSDGFR